LTILLSKTAKVRPVGSRGGEDAALVGNAVIFVKVSVGQQPSTQDGIPKLLMSSADRNAVPPPHPQSANAPHRELEGDCTPPNLPTSGSNTKSGLLGILGKNPLNPLRD